MKINLTLDQNHILSGFVNINPISNPQSQTQIACDVADLGMLVDDGEAEEIIVLDLLDFIDLPNKNKILDHWLSKLSHGGSITLSGREIHECAKVIFNRSIDVPTANILLYGDNLLRKGICSVDFIKNMLTNKGLIIENVKVENVNYCVKAVRP